MLSWRLLLRSGQKFHVREVTPFYRAAPQQEHREPRTIPNRGEGGEGRARSRGVGTIPSPQRKLGKQAEAVESHHPPCKSLNNSTDGPISYSVTSPMPTMFTAGRSLPGTPVGLPLPPTEGSAHQEPVGITSKTV